MNQLCRVISAAVTAPPHARESLAPRDVDGGPAVLLTDCSCGASFTTPAGGPDEGSQADAAMEDHAAGRKAGHRIVSGFVVAEAPRKELAS